MEPGLAILAAALSLNASIGVTAALAAMSCALVGVWLVLRRQSMLGDALSHTALPGIVIAFLIASAAQSAGWIDRETLSTWEHVLLLAGAVLAGVMTSWLTEGIQRLGRVEANAALGVVFTSLFALGLFLIRSLADDVHLDTDCVLFGNLAEVALRTVEVAGVQVPEAAVVNGGLLLVNTLLTLLFFKELRISAFDPELATAQGIGARRVHRVHLAVTAVTAVAAFESVGSILVVSLLVVPAATAHLLTDRLKTLIILSVLLAAASAVIGHRLSQTLAPFVFARIGFPQVEDVSVSGMIAVAAGGLYVVAWFVAPRHGLLASTRQGIRIASRIAAEDLLGQLYRHGERGGGPIPAADMERPAAALRCGSFLVRWALWKHQRRGLIASSPTGYSLTPAGIAAAREIVRSHRLWESYLERHFELPADHLHESAHRAEHYLDADLREQMASELDAPRRDPHGRNIP